MLSCGAPPLSADEHPNDGAIRSIHDPSRQQRSRATQKVRDGCEGLASRRDDAGLVGDEVVDRASIRESALIGEDSSMDSELLLSVSQRDEGSEGSQSILSGEDEDENDEVEMRMGDEERLQASSHTDVLCSGGRCQDCLLYTSPSPRD